MTGKPIAAVSRRAMLRGVGGAALGLPLLDVFEARPARGADAVQPVYSLFIVGCNGVMQHWPFHEEAEKLEAFWPKIGDAPGGYKPFALPIDKAMLEADRPTRAVGELAEYADRLLLVKGVDHPFPAVGCTHHSGNQEVLTAARVSQGKDFQDQLAQGESLDTRIARVLNPDKREPLSLHAGENKAGGTGYGYPSYVSFRGPRMPRAAEPNPWNAYNRIVGLSNVAPELAAKIKKGRTSVNDLVRAQLQRLLSRKDLSMADRKRLDQHFGAIRDIEVKLAGDLAPATRDALQAVSGKQHANENHDKVVRLHLDLCAFAFASDYTRTAVIKTGDINDRTRWTIDGTLQPVFHMISHRVMSDGASGPPIANATGIHAKIDRIQIGYLKYFLDQVRNLDTAHGKLIDLGFYCSTNQIGTGKYHSFRDIPWVIAGGARGYLKTGLFVNVSPVQVNDSQRTKSNKLLTTLLAAAGVREPDGSPVDDFGDAGLSKGVLPEIIK